MNFKRRTGRYAGLICFGLIILFFYYSCKKDGPTKAVISVIDMHKAPVVGATVTLWQDTAVNPVNGVQSTLRVTKLSDAAGQAEFEFELESFLNIEVISSTDTGRSFIRLKEHETVTATVSI